MPKAATDKKDGWRENHSPIASKMKSMLMGGGRRQIGRQDQVQDGG